MLAVITIVALASYWWMVLVPPTVRAHAPQPAVAVNQAAAAVRAAPVTMAVLPFDNLSGDAGLQSFSDGISEDISAALGKMPGLRLVASGSAFQLKRNEETRDLRDDARGALPGRRSGPADAKSRQCHRAADTD